MTARRATNLRRGPRQLTPGIIARVIQLLPRSDAPASAQREAAPARPGPRRRGWMVDPAWTEDQDRQLIEGYGKIKVPELAARIGRSRAAIYARARHHGLVHGVFALYTNEQLAAFRIAYDRGLAIADLAFALGRQLSSVSKYAIGLGYRFGVRPKRATPMSLADILALCDPSIPLPPEKAGPARRKGPQLGHHNETWTAERRETFLRELEATGDIKAALAAAGTAYSSKQAAYKQRGRNPDFGRRWDEIMRAHRARQRKPHHLETWTPERREQFLAALERSGTLTAALKDVGASTSVYGARRRYPDFDARVKALLSANPSRASDWTPAEDQRLRAAYAAGERIDLVAQEIGRPMQGVLSRAAKIGVSGTLGRRGGACNEREWTDDQDAVLRELYGTIPTTELAQRLGRSKGGVFGRSWRLGLTHGFHRNWSEEEQRALAIAHRRGLPLSALPGALGRKFGGVAKYAENHGLSFGKRPQLAAPITLAEILALDDPAAPLPATAPRKAKAKPAREAKPRAPRRPPAPKPAPRPKSAPFARALPPPPAPSTCRRAGRISHGLGLRSYARTEAPQPATRRKSDAEIAAETLRYLEERKRLEALSHEPALTLDNAKLTLQRRGKIVCSMSVYGGDPGLWYVSGLGKDCTPEQIVAEAKRLAA